MGHASVSWPKRIHARLGSDKLDRLTSYVGHLVGNTPSIVSTVAFEWFEFGAELSARGSHRLLVAEHAARAAATGGGKLMPHEEDAIAAWFAGVVAEGISRTSGAKPDDLDGEHNAFASAVWYFLVGADWHRDLHTIRRHVARPWSTCGPRASRGSALR